MSRSPKAVKPPHNMAQPLLNFKPDPKDCFGLQWEAGCVECSYCAAQSSCSVVFFQQNNGTYKYPALDDVDMKTIPFHKFVPMLQDVTFDELTEAITEYTKGVVDPDTIHIFTLNKLKEHGFKTSSDGRISAIGN